MHRQKALQAEFFNRKREIPLMNVLQQDRRYLLLLVSAVMNQKKVPAMSGSLMPWRTIYRLADINQVANLCWLGILGLSSEIDKEIKGLFYESYQRELKNVSGYQSAEEVLIWQLERKQIHFLILEGKDLRELYPQKEMRKMDCISILVPKGDLVRIDTIMRSMDYEPQENREDEGILYYKIPGIYVKFYDKIKFVNLKLERYFDSPVRMYSKKKGYRYLRCFDKEEAYLYMAGRAANDYALGRATVRTVLDFWLYEKAHKEELNWPYVDKVLKRHKILEFSERLLKLGDIWFQNGISSEMDIYTAMEAYILSKGEQGRQLSGKILPLLQDVADFYKRDRRREWMNREKEALFPPRDYMAGMFPVLKKFPWLYGLCCLLRLWRIWFSKVKQFFAEKRDQLKAKLTRKKDAEEAPPDSQEEHENNIRME